MSQDIKKLATDNPIIDEIVYQCQKMIQGVVLKDEARANKNETITSRRESDMYKTIIEGKARFEYFSYGYDLLYKVPSLTKDQIVQYTRYNEIIPQSIRPTLLELAKKKFLKNYQEKNNYYRMLNGLPDYNEPGILLNKDDIEKLDDEFFDHSQYIHEMDNDDIDLLRSKGIIDDLIERYPKAEYLKHLGDAKIDPYTARAKQPFSILYLPTCESMEVYNKFYERIEINREFIMRTIYSEAYKFRSDYYDNFIMMMIIIQALDDMIVLSPEYIITRDLFDLRTIQFIFEASGVHYYKEIPLKYQKRLVKNLNRLIKYSSCEKNFVDIASLFGFENIEIFKYYILRQPLRDENGEFKHNTIIDPETGKDIDDVENNYQLEFVKVPIDGIIDDYIRNDLYRVGYDEITDKDRYWTGVYNKEYVKSQILKKDFNIYLSKYMSIDTIYSMTDMSFDIVYFINMLLYSGVNMSALKIQLPELSSKIEFELTDLFITLYALGYIYHGFEDNIIYDPASALEIKGFNFNTDMDKLAAYVNSKGYTLEELGVSGFVMPKSGVLSFGQLMEVYLNNKNIYDHLVNEIRNVKDKDMYDIYKYIYDSLMVTKLNYKYFKKAGNGKLPKTYTDYIKNRNNFLYVKLEDCKDILKEYDRQTEVSRIINIIVDNIYIYLNSDDFRYIFQGIPTVSLDYIKQYMFNILDFFKSYKITFVGSNDIFYFDDKLENRLFILDKIKMRFKAIRKSFLGIEDYPKWILHMRYKDGLTIEDDVIINKR